MIRNKKFLKSIFFVLLGAACLVSINSIIQIQKYGHWINYLGIVRGASQRIFKLESNHKENNELLKYIDDILYDLSTGKGKYGLPYIQKDIVYTENLKNLNIKWKLIKNDIYDVRKGKENSELLKASEDFFELANNTVFSGEKYARKQATYLTLLIILLSVSSLITWLFIFIMHTKNQIFLEKLNDKLKDIVYKDELTGDGNLKKFKLDAEKLIKENSEIKFAVFYLDFENFKYCNDVLGYKFGDYILKEYNKLLKEDMKDKETFGRVSADRFVVLRKYKDKHELIERQKHIDEKLKKIVEKSNERYNAAIYYGICCLEDIKEEMKIDELIDKANFAQKTIKGQVINYAFYNENIRNKMREENYIRDNILKAIENEEFVVYFQPKVELKEKKIRNAEALVRWKNSLGKLIPPGLFIPILEKDLLISVLDQYVFEKTCQWLKKQMKECKRILPVSVNVSKMQFYSLDFIEVYSKLKKKYGVPNNIVIIEFTESAIFNDIKRVKEIIDELHINGFLCSIDDFGNGYSSLNALKDMKVDSLKIDSLFFNESENKRREEIIIKGIITLAKELNMKTVAEGIEKQEQVDFLREAGCDLIQGYIFYRPMPIEDFEKLENINWISYDE
ncbi:bifunctional diguanylate cyclase/phosphodiesterase [Fusobacterium varium]|uniref:putative bifunctional diguanylate cyclase/phosphodiesterase n=1 Tax=Fusobacterium varium TaxID=856 RepID=UPI000BBA8D9D|nr:EAL domain-containing protein [uncultured Fusobacterium sp.]BBA50553.1 putative bacterial signaling protein [Fusobacterium varium]